VLHHVDNRLRLGDFAVDRKDPIEPFNVLPGAFPHCHFLAEVHRSQNPLTPVQGIPKEPSFAHRDIAFQIVIAGVGDGLPGGLLALTLGQNPWRSLACLTRNLAVIDPMFVADFLLDLACLLRVDGVLSLAFGDRNPVPRSDAFEPQFR